MNGKYFEKFKIINIKAQLLNKNLTKKSLILSPVLFKIPPSIIFMLFFKFENHGIINGPSSKIKESLQV